GTTREKTLEAIIVAFDSNLPRGFVEENYKIGDLLPDGSTVWSKIKSKLHFWSLWYGQIAGLVDYAWSHAVVSDETKPSELHVISKVMILGATAIAPRLWMKFSDNINRSTSTASTRPFVLPTQHIQKTKNFQSCSKRPNQTCFGVVLLELICGSAPLRLIRSPSCTKRYLLAGNLEDIFSAATREYALVVEELWNHPAMQATYKRTPILVDDMGGYMIVSLDKKWGKVAKLFGLGQEHQDEVKELYKEYIGMAKVYYEEAKRSKHGKPGIVGENCIGDAGNGRPQGDARMEDAEVEEGKPDKTQGTDDQDDVKGNNSSDAASNKEAQSMTSSDDLIIIV
ncbi:ARID DNA-binding domain-containing protein, partial [Tanacetum coccineum]